MNKQEGAARGYFCAKHGEFAPNGICKWCEPADAPSVVPTAAYIDVVYPSPPLKNHFVIATKAQANYTYGYLCNCGYAAEFPGMAAHLQFGNAAPAAQKDLP